MYENEIPEISTSVQNIKEDASYAMIVGDCVKKRREWDTTCEPALIG